MSSKSKEIPALPGNFTRTKKGSQLIEQEMRKLLELDAIHHAKRPLLTPDGKFRMKDQKGLPIEGPSWDDICARTPNWFSKRFEKIRNKDEFGRAVHSKFVALTGQLSSEGHSRTEFITMIYDIIQGTNRHCRRKQCPLRFHSVSLVAGGVRCSGLELSRFQT